MPLGLCIRNTYEERHSANGIFLQADPSPLSSAEQGTYIPIHKRTSICLSASFFLLPISLLQENSVLFEYTIVYL